MSNTASLAWHLATNHDGTRTVVLTGTGSGIGHLAPTFEGNGWVAFAGYTGRRLGRSDNITRAALLVVEAYRAVSA